MNKPNRPEIKDDSRFIIETLIERGIYKSSTEVVSKALELLFEKQIENDVKAQILERPDYSEVFEIQSRE